MKEGLRIRFGDPFGFGKTHKNQWGKRSFGRGGGRLGSVPRQGEGTGRREIHKVIHTDSGARRKTRPGEPAREKFGLAIVASQTEERVVSTLKAGDQFAGVIVAAPEFRK